MEAATPRGSAGVFCTESEAAGARALDPGLSLAREAAFKGSKTKNATSCGNVFETNILLASQESVRSNANQPLLFIEKRMFPKPK